MAGDTNATPTLTWAQTHAISSIGKKRTKNDDAWLLQAWPDKSAVLAVVADGIGGSQAGGTAAQLAVATMGELLKEPLPATARDRYDRLLKQIYEADARIRDQGSQSFETLGMGTTIVAALITPTEYLHLYAGDSRLYHFRDRQPLYKTADHSIVRILVDIGKITEEQVPTHPMRSVINSCLGGKHGDGNFAIDPKWDDAHPPIRPLAPEDLLLLASDGLHGVLTDADLTQLVAQHPADLPQLAEALINAALERGAPDNVTLALVQCTAHASI